MVSEIQIFEAKSALKNLPKKMEFSKCEIFKNKKRHSIVSETFYKT